MIFLWVGLALLGVAIFVYALIKWIIPSISKAIKNRKNSKEQANNEHNEEKVNEVQYVQGSHDEEVAYGGSYSDVIDGQKIMYDAEVQQNNEDQEQSLEDLFNKVHVPTSVKDEINQASPRLKAILLSGVLQDKKYEDL